jgi:hypothetical protein
MIVFLQAISAEAVFFTDDSLEKQGELFTIKMIVGESISFHVVGNEEAVLDLKQLQLTIRKLLPAPQRLIQFERKGDQFILTDIFENEKIKVIEVTTKVKDKKETFHFIFHAPLR